MSNPMSQRIAWLVPKLIEGSGGHRTILHHAAALESAGFKCSIYIESDGKDKAAAAHEIQRLFGYRFADAVYGWNEVAPADLVFATVWYSAQVVRDLSFPCRKAYFVQDYEASFNPMGDAYLMAENSYRYGLHPITIGRWLTSQLRSAFNVPAEYFDFCADLSIYRAVPNVRREKAVCFIHQPEKPRRCARLGIEALGIVKDRMPEVKVYLYGSSRKEHVWFQHSNLGLLGLEDCNMLYNRCTAGLCISASNPSRIPFEMMAAGLPVVELWRENTLYDFPEEAALLCDQTPQSIAEGLLRLLADRELCQRMGEAGAAFMRNRPLETGTNQFLEAARRLLSGDDHSSVQPLDKLYKKAAVAEQNFVNTLPAQPHDANWSRSGRKSASRPGRWRKFAKRILSSARLFSSS
jgi:glycosyltransferase involved in cell wall biosynthesis